MQTSLMLGPHQRRLIAHERDTSLQPTRCNDMLACLMPGQAWGSDAGKRSRVISIVKSCLRLNAIITNSPSRFRFFRPFSSPSPLWDPWRKRGGLSTGTAELRVSGGNSLTLIWTNSMTKRLLLASVCFRNSSCTALMS